jgi:hypothetical protein
MDAWASLIDTSNGAERGVDAGPAAATAHRPMHAKLDMPVGEGDIRRWGPV